MDWVQRGEPRLPWALLGHYTCETRRDQATTWWLWVTENCVARLPLGGPGAGQACGHVQTCTIAQTWRACKQACPGCRVVVVGPGKCANRCAQARRRWHWNIAGTATGVNKCSQVNKGMPSKCWCLDRLAGKQAILHQVVNLGHGRHLVNGSDKSATWQPWDLIGHHVAALGNGKSAQQARPDHQVAIWGTWYVCEQESSDRHTMVKGHRMCIPCSCLEMWQVRTGMPGHHLAALAYGRCANACVQATPRWCWDTADVSWLLAGSAKT